MRLTIIPSDSQVGVNNNFIAGLDLSTCNIPANIHALQWYEFEGELEFVDNKDRTKPQNEVITKLPDWVDSCVIVYNNAKFAEEEAARLAEEAARPAEEAARLAQAEKTISTTQI